MLDTLLRGLIKSEAAALKRRAVGGCVLLMGATFGLLASIFAAIAAFELLQSRMPAWSAALLIAAVLAVLGLIIFLIGRNMMQSRPAEPVAVSQVLNSLNTTTDKAAPAPRSAGQTILGAIATAAVIGVLLGRRFQK